jgi:hypothetical protein
MFIKCIILLTLSLISIAAGAQTFAGRIIDTDRQAIPNATLYIRQTAQGIMSDEHGAFRITLPAGEYTCEISSLGYDKQLLPVVLPAEGLTIDVILKEKTYALREVTVTPGKEDPAYRIIRRVIALAPLHRRQILSYSSEVYTKGSFKVEKVPAILLRRIKDPEMKELIGQAHVYEAQNRITFTQPDLYEQHLMARTTTLPEKYRFDDAFASRLLRENIYAPGNFGGLLSPGSFGVYKFHLEDSYTEDDHLIAKILFTPRKKNPSLLTGELYIVEDLWAVRQARVNITQGILTASYNLTYQEIRPQIYLPIAYDMTLHLSTMGIKGNGNFYTSIKYDAITINENYADVNADTSVQTGRAPSLLSKKQLKAQKQLDQLLAKDNLTTREAYKTSKLMAETTISEEERARNRNLEIRSRDSLITLTRDSLATLRDSTFWQTTRVLPLHNDEALSYLRRDSLRAIAALSPDSLAALRRRQRHPLTKIISGDYSRASDSLRFNYSYGGLVAAFDGYNFVDGFLLGQKLQTAYRLRPNHTLYLNTAASYATARRSANLSLTAALTYAPLRNGLLRFDAGNTSSDYIADAGTSRAVNTIYSLGYALNPAKYYLRRYLSLSNSIDLSNGLRLDLTASHERRDDLQNHTSFSFFGSPPASNLPAGQVAPMPAHRATIATIALAYTPRHYYRILSGRKHYQHTAFPTFSLSCTRAFPTSTASTDYSLLELSISQTISLDRFDRLTYYLNAGRFLTADRLYLPDYKHFAVNELYLTDRPLLRRFSTLDSYTTCSTDHWLHADLAFNSDYLLVKRLPFLQSYLFSENIHLRLLRLPDRLHSETGYSAGMAGLGHIGLFVGLSGFKRLHYENFSITVSLPLFQPTKEN